MKSIQQGFTLIELLIVIVIIGVLAAIAFPQYQNYVARTEVSAALAEITGLKTQVETCLLDGKDATVIVDGDNTECAKLAVIGSKVATFTGSGNEADGTANLTALLDKASAKVKAKKLELNRTANGEWSCSGDMDEIFKPKSCQ